MRLEFIINRNRKYNSDEDKRFLFKLFYAADTIFNSRSREHEF
jgi:hypothetical protein